MISLAGLAAFVGLVHSLAPGHWLPVVLMTKSRRWSMGMAALGALTAALGHILVSTTLALASIWVGSRFIHGNEEQLERVGGYLLISFGAAYALNAYFRHSHCHGHEHHGPEPSNNHSPFVFLFLLGFSPCVAVLPVFAAAATHGAATAFVTMAAFSLGVVSALLAGTLMVARGFMKLDHPIFEHYGDVITGVGVALMGVILLLVPHAHDLSPIDEHGLDQQHGSEISH